MPYRPELIINYNAERENSTYWWRWRAGIRGRLQCRLRDPVFIRHEKGGIGCVIMHVLSYSLRGATATGIE